MMFLLVAAAFTGCASTDNNVDMKSKVFSLELINVNSYHYEGSFNNNTNDKRDGK